jgi:transcriptional regulator with XRE-family HTH domain
MKELTQSQLGEAIYQSKENISKYERGKVTPPIDVLIDLATFFDCELNDLVDTKIHLNKRNIVLNRTTFFDYYSNDLVKDTPVSIKVDEKIHLLNILKKLAIIDNLEDIPHIEYLEGNKYYQPLDFYDSLINPYERRFVNSEISNSKGILTVEEYLKIVYSLGAELDYSGRPSSIKLLIEDEFLVLSKLASLIDDDAQETIEVNFNELILFLVPRFYEVTFTKEGYKKHNEVIDKMFWTHYDIGFDSNRIDAPMDEAHFLYYINDCLDEWPEKVEDIYNDFNEKGRDIYLEIGLPFIEEFCSGILNEYFKNKINIRINYEVKEKPMILNGILDSMKNSVEKFKPSAYINYLIMSFVPKEEFEDLWTKLLYKHLKTYNVDLSTSDILSIPKIFSNRLKYSSRRDIFTVHNDVIKTHWALHGQKILDLKTLKIVKALFYKSIE